MADDLATPQNPGKESPASPKIPLKTQFWQWFDRDESYGVVAGLSMLAVSCAWWYLNAGRGSWVALGGILLGGIAWLLHRPRVVNKMFGVTDLALKEGRQEIEKVTLATILSFVGLIAFDLQYLKI